VTVGLFLRASGAIAAKYTSTYEIAKPILRTPMLLMALVFFFGFDKKSIALFMMMRYDTQRSFICYLTHKISTNSKNYKHSKHSKTCFGCFFICQKKLVGKGRHTF
jgi:hypothetical protein